MAERNVDIEAKAVDKLVELYDNLISIMADNIVDSGKSYVYSESIDDELDDLDKIERALKRLLTPLLKP